MLTRSGVKRKRTGRDRLPPKKKAVKAKKALAPKCAKPTAVTPVPVRPLPLSETKLIELRKIETKWMNIPSQIRELNAKLAPIMERRQKVLQKLAYHDRVGKRLVKTIAVHEKRLRTIRNQLQTTPSWRHLGAVMNGFTDELLAVVLAELEYNHQQRLVRVCQRWKNTVASFMDHLYIHNDELTKDFDRTELALQDNAGEEELSDQSKRPVTLDWKYRCPAVRRIAISARHSISSFQYRPSSRLTEMVSNWAKRYPNLALITFTHHWLRSDMVVALSQLAQRHPEITVNIRSSRIFALPDLVSTLSHIGSLIEMLINFHVDGLFEAMPTLYYDTSSRHRMEYYPSPTLVFTSSTDISKVIEQTIWPYTDEQLVWLAKYAPNLPDIVIKEIFQRIPQSATYDSRYSNRLCEEHQRLCDHLPVSFYRDELDAQVRTMLVLLILDLKASAGDMPPQPLTFTQVNSYDGAVWRY